MLERFRWHPLCMCYVMAYSDKKIWSALTILIPLLIILLLTTAFKVQFFSYSNDGISDLKKIYKMATCKHELYDVGYFLQDKNGNYYDMDYVLKYLDNHPESDREGESDLERPGTGYGECTKCGYIINHYVVGRVKGTKYIYEYDDVKHKNSTLGLDGPKSHLHGCKEKDKNLKKSIHTWTGWKTIKTHELGDIQVRSCSVCGIEDYRK